MGSCLIPKENGSYCGKQIQEGEPIGTIGLGTPPQPVIGHKACADDYERRAEATVKIGRQQGPGGPIGDPSGYDDALAFGSVPLEKPESPEPAPELNQVRMPEGVRPLSELPMDDEVVNPQVRQYVTGQVPETGLTHHEREVMEAFRTGGAEAVRVLEERKAKGEPVTHVITLDMSQVPENAQRLQINLDWP